MAIAACLVPRFHSTPSTNTVVTAGAKVIGILLMASKMVPNWSPCVDQSIASTMMTPGRDPADAHDARVGRLRAAGA